MSATTDDKGYLGRLPCLTTNTVNPFSFNGGGGLGENLGELHARLPLAAHDGDDASTVGAGRTVHVEHKR